MKTYVRKDYTTKIKDAIGVYRAFGIDFANKKQFPKKANIANIFCTEETFQKYVEEISAGNKKMYKDAAKNSTYWAFPWYNYGPTTTGPRYQAVDKAIEIKNDAIYVMEEGDEYPGVVDDETVKWEEAFNVFEENSDEQDK